MFRWLVEHFGTPVYSTKDGSFLCWHFFGWNIYFPPDGKGGE